MHIRQERNGPFRLAILLLLFLGLRRLLRRHGPFTGSTSANVATTHKHGARSEPSGVALINKHSDSATLAHSRITLHVLAVAAVIFIVVANSLFIATIPTGSGGKSFPGWVSLVIDEESAQAGVEAYLLSGSLTPSDLRSEDGTRWGFSIGFTEPASQPQGHTVRWALLATGAAALADITISHLPREGGRIEAVLQASEARRIKPLSPPDDEVIEQVIVGVMKAEERVPPGVTASSDPTQIKGWLQAPIVLESSLERTVVSPPGIIDWARDVLIRGERYSAPAVTEILVSAGWTPNLARLNRSYPDLNTTTGGSSTVSQIEDALFLTWTRSSRIYVADFTDPNAAATGNRLLFISGTLLGVAGGAVIAFIEGAFRSFRPDRLRSLLAARRRD